MKQLFKSTLLALGILPLGFFADEARAENQKAMVYTVKSEILFTSPHSGMTREAFGPFDPKQLGLSFDLNSDFYFYNLITNSVLKKLQSTNPETITLVDKIPLRSGYTVQPKVVAPKPVPVVVTRPPVPVAVLPTPTLVQQPVFEPTRPDALYTQSRLILEFEQGQYSGGFGDAMIPFAGTADNFFFADLVGAAYGPVYQTYSAGVGHRQVINNAIYGFYGFYDRQQSQANFYYNRVSGGVERLGMTWDMRANFYFYPNTPNNVQDLGQVSAFIKANTNDIYYNHLYDVKKASSGADVELGRTLGLDNLRGYVGAYSFGQYVNGGRARFTYDVTPHWQVNGMGQFDDARGWLAMGGISYMLGRTEVTHTIIDRIREAVVRDLTVPEATIDNYGELDLDTRKIYFASPTGSGGAAGTQNNPTSLDNAFLLAQPGDFIYMEGGNYTLDQVINLKANQIFWGTGADLRTQGATGFLLLAKSGTASALDTSGIVTAANNSGNANCGTAYVCAIYADNAAKYGGFTLKNGTTYTGNFVLTGFLISNTNGVNIDTVNVSGFNTSATAGTGTGAGFTVDDSNTSHSAAILTHITSDNNDNGLNVVNGSANVGGTLNDFSNNTTNGITVTSGSGAPSHLVITNATINDNGHLGIYTSGTGARLDNPSALTVSGNAVGGIRIDNGSTLSHGENITITGNGTDVSLVDSIGGYGLEANNGSTITSTELGNFNIYGNGVNEHGTTPALVGVQVLADNSTITLYNSSMQSFNGNYNIASQNGAVVNILNANTLSGTVNVHEGALKITDKKTGTVVDIHLEPLYISSFQCSITSGITGSCTAPPQP